MAEQRPFRPKLRDSGIITNSLAFKPIAVRRKEALCMLLRREATTDSETLTACIEMIVERIDRINDQPELMRHASDRNMFVRAAVAFSPLAGKQIREELESDDNATVRYVAAISVLQLKHIRSDLNSVGLSIIGAIKKMNGVNHEGKRAFLKELHATAHGGVRSARRSG